MKCKIFFLLLLTSQISASVIYNLNDTEYLKMPPVFHLDDYHSCLDQSNGTYCYADIDLVSDSPSNLLQMIREYSEHTSSHFNHTQLHYGICLTRTCKHFVQENKLEDPRIILEKCLNESMWRDYQLKTKLSNKISCKSFDDPMNIDIGDIFAAIMFLCIVLFNIIGSLYDSYFVKGGEELSGNRLLLSFSFKRNLKKLVAHETNEQLAESLRGLNGIRSLSIIFVILIHSPLPFIIASQNTHEVEKTYHKIVYHLYFSGHLIMQTFFVISGCLLAKNFRLHTEKNTVSWRLITRLILKRWVRRQAAALSYVVIIYCGHQYALAKRSDYSAIPPYASHIQAYVQQWISKGLTPAYAVMLTFTLTWIRFIASGPLWEVAVGVEVTDCRRDAWWSMIYLNNYIDNSQCMVQTWYLAANMQLYILGIFVCVLGKTSKRRNIIVLILFIIGVVIPAILTYIQDLDALLLISPEISRNFFVKDPTFNHSYKRGYTNIPSMMLGLALGNIVYNGWKNKNSMKKYKKRGLLYYLTIPMIAVLMLSGILFYGDRPRLSIYFRTIASALFRPLFGLLTTIFCIGMVFKFENFCRKIVEWRGWRTFARVSYSAYLIHVSVIRVFTGSNTTLSELGIAQCAKEITANIFVTFVIAYPFWLFVETPLNQAFLNILGLTNKVTNGDGNCKVEDISALHKQETTTELNGEKYFENIRIKQ